MPRVASRPIAPWLDGFLPFFCQPVFPRPDIPFSIAENLTIRSKLTLEEAGVAVK
jgi:hypothetical protein